MSHYFLPDKFIHFIEPINTIINKTPVSISLIGSYGNINKKPTEKSDLDIIFVFKSDCIINIFKDCLNDLYKISNLEIIELGVHFQYGYVISIYYNENPMCWVDIGIMDENFAKNYLVNIPRTVVYGNIIGSDIGQSPINQMNHLARKIISAFNSKQELILETACYKYIGWWKVLDDIQKIRTDSSDENTFIRDLYTSYSRINKKINIVDTVMHDIQNRFPLISSQQKITSP